MEVEAFDDAAGFLDSAASLLLENEAANNLILGVAGMQAEDPTTFDEFTAWVVRNRGALVAAAARTPPQNLILAMTPSREGVTRLASEVGDLPGVVACRPGVEHFLQARHERARLTMSQGIFQLDSVVVPPQVEGVSRPARRDEIDELVEWRLAFQEEALGETGDPDQARRATEGRLREQSSQLGLWVHEARDRLVSMSGHQGPTPNGIRVSLVYTPPEHRGKGYASALVATQSQWLLDNGHRFCFLYTDLANPTSNAIYPRIGYRQIAESAEYKLSPIR